MNGFIRRTVTDDRYSRLLENHVEAALRQRGYLTTTIFMQDGETAHTARYVKDVIQANFSDERVISQTFPIFWYAKSPDLELGDFWQECFLKDHVYQGRVTNFADLKSNIVRHVALIPADMLRVVVDNVVL